MACVIKARSYPQFNRAGNLKGVAGFKKQAELYPYKNWSKSPTSSTFSFTRLANSNVKVLTICLGYWCLWQQQGENQLTAQIAYFDDQVPAERRLLPTIADSDTLFLMRGD